MIPGNGPVWGGICFPGAIFFLLDRVQKIERIEFSIALHIPMREGAVDRIAQQNYQLDRRIVVMDALHRRFPVGVNRRAGPGDQRPRGCRNIAVEQLVVNIAGSEHLLVVVTWHGNDPLPALRPERQVNRRGW